MGAWAVSAWLLSLVIDGFLLFASIFRVRPHLTLYPLLAIT